ncbi:MAG: hypothetical protein M3463_09870, partial [Verrucomicrobiota bacterium]|nr:hypothetical protein [Verrucomicrobiota bacterium]
MKTGAHLWAVALMAMTAGLLFLREPGFGDDLTYWSFAFDLHERGVEKAWQKGSFHDLRWPVWGVCWLLQPLTGFGLASYYGEPLLYLAAGASLAFAFGRLVTRSTPIGWGCAIAFVFHPLLDTVCYRPMPDLSEGVWGAAVLLAWWALMHAQRPGLGALLALLVGAGVFIAESNRITGVFIIPVLVLCTLLFFRRRFGWLVLAGLVAVLFYGAECLFYKQLFGNWLHNLEANMGGKGRAGTGAIALWYLPLRFLDSLWKGNPLAPVYFLLGALGIWASWRKFGVAGRVVVIWFVTLYLEYACAPQSLWPWRPLIRDADRFLCGLAVPASVLAVVGLNSLGELPWPRREAVREWIRTRGTRLRPLHLGVLAALALLLITSREKFNLGFVPEMRAYLRSRPEGTKVFTHKGMREFCFLIDPKSSRDFAWHAPNAILHHDPKLEAIAAQCAEFWYIRKLVWLNTRKQLERKTIGQQAQLASYFETPEREWRMTRLLAKGDTPDLIFYRRREPGTPPPQILESAAPEFHGLIPPLPAEWRNGRDPGTIDREWQIPAEWRGDLARLELEGASDEVQALTIRLRFHQEEKLLEELLLKPYFHPIAGKEFFALRIPGRAERCEVQLRFSKDAKSVRVSAFRAVLE